MARGAVGRRFIHHNKVVTGEDRCSISGSSPLDQWTALCDYPIQRGQGRQFVLIEVTQISSGYASGLVKSGLAVGQREELDGLARGDLRLHK